MMYIYLLGFLYLWFNYYKVTDKEYDVNKYNSQAFYDGLAGKPFKSYYNGTIKYDELDDLELIVYIHKDCPWSKKLINNLKDVF